MSEDRTAPVIPTSQSTGGVQGGTYVPPAPFVPYVPPAQAWPPLVSYTVTTSLTLAEKAEIVLAILLARLTDNTWVEICENDETVASPIPDEGAFYVQIQRDADFEEIVHDLYAAIACPRGRALR